MYCIWQWEASIPASFSSFRNTYLVGWVTEKSSTVDFARAVQIGLAQHIRRGKIGPRPWVPKRLEHGCWVTSSVAKNSSRFVVRSYTCVCRSDFFPPLVIVDRVSLTCCRQSWRPSPVPAPPARPNRWSCSCAWWARGAGGRASRTWGRSQTRQRPDKIDALFSYNCDFPVLKKLLRGVLMLVPAISLHSEKENSNALTVNQSGSTRTWQGASQ